MNHIQNVMESTAIKTSKKITFLLYMDAFILKTFVKQQKTAVNKMNAFATDIISGLIYSRKFDTRSHYIATILRPPLDILLQLQHMVYIKRAHVCPRAWL